MIRRMVGILRFQLGLLVMVVQILIMIILISIAISINLPLIQRFNKTPNACDLFRLQAFVLFDLIDSSWAISDFAVHLKIKKLFEQQGMIQIGSIGQL